jgi:hypothetical protein
MRLSQSHISQYVILTRFQKVLVYKFEETTVTMLPHLNFSFDACDCWHCSVCGRLHIRHIDVHLLPTTEKRKTNEELSEITATIRQA